MYVCLYVYIYMREGEGFKPWFMNYTTTQPSILSAPNPQPQTCLLLQCDADVPYDPPAAAKASRPRIVSQDKV